MTQAAVDALCGTLAQVPQDESEWQQKSQIITDFARDVSDRVLTSLGYSVPGADDWHTNPLVEIPMDPGSFDNPPDDFIKEMYLKDVPASFLVPNPDKVLADYHLVFCKGRVFQWSPLDPLEDMPVMTYEAAARLVIFWLMKKILCIIEENQWDRVAQLPNLFDRLAQFTREKKLSPKVSGDDLARQFELHYKLEVLLIKVNHKERHSLTAGAITVLERAEVTCLGDLAQKTTRQLKQVSGCGEVKVKRFQELLEEFHLSLGMKLQPEVLLWFEAQK